MCNFPLYNNVSFKYTPLPSVVDGLKGMPVVEYSIDGSSNKVAEMQAWVHFGNFLDECEGNDVNIYFFCRGRLHPPLGFDHDA